MAQTKQKSATRAAIEADFQAYHSGIATKDKPGDAAEVKGLQTSIPEGYEENAKQIKRLNSRNRTLDVSRYANAKPQKSGKIEELKLAGLYSSSTRIKDTSNEFTRKSTVLGGIRQRRETFGVSQDASAENGLASLNRLSKTTRNPFRERTVTYAQDDKPRSVTSRTAGLLAKSNEEFADGTKVLTGRKVKGFFETSLGPINESGQRVRETKRSFFGLTYAKSTELTDHKGATLKTIASSRPGYSYAIESNGQNQLKLTESGIIRKKVTISDEKGIVSSETVRGPFRSTNVRPTGDTPGARTFSIGERGGFLTISRETPVTGDTKKLSVNIFGLVKISRNSAMSTTELEQRDKLVALRPVVNNQAQPQNPTVAERAANLVRQVPEAAREVATSVAQNVQNGATYVRNNPGTVALGAASVLGTAALASAAFKASTPATMAAIGAQGAKMAWQAGNQMYAAWNRQSDVASTSGPASATLATPRLQSVTSGTVSAGPKETSSQTGRRESATLMEIVQRSQSDTKPNTPKSVFENDPSRSWIGLGTQVAAKLVSPTGRSELISSAVSVASKNVFGEQPTLEAAQARGLDVRAEQRTR